MITYFCNNCGWKEEVPTVEDAVTPEQYSLGALLQRVGGNAKTYQRDFYYTCPKCHNGGIRKSGRKKRRKDTDAHTEQAVV